MNPALKLLVFGLILGLLFAGGALAGKAIDPDPGEAEEEVADAHGEEGGTDAHGSEGAAEGSEDDAHGSTDAAHGAGGQAHPVRGLGVAEGRLRLVLDQRELARGRRQTVRFRIVGEKGTVREFDVEHEKRMHMIVARRDLTRFQHLHPKQARDGSWSTGLRLDEAGSYRLFADFSYKRKPYTLATDIAVDGPVDLRPIPAALATAESDGGYQVELDAKGVRAGKAAQLRFTISSGGRTIHTEPYLGAGGHLVALREGDLAFLHVHPTEDDHGGEGSAEDDHDDSVGFEATFPTAGKYRLFLQFKHEGRIHTVAFTQEVK